MNLQGHLIHLCLMSVLLILPLHISAAPSVDVTVQPAIPVSSQQSYGFTGIVFSLKSGDISFRAEGVVASTATPGTEVHDTIKDQNGRLLREGDILATLNAQWYQIAVSAAHARVKGAQAAYNSKTKDYERCKTLAASDNISQAQLEDAEVQFLSAEVQLLQMKSALEQAQYLLDSCVLRAPYSGIIDAVYEPPGTWINEGDPILHLAMMVPAGIKIQIPERLAQQLGIGDLVQIYPLGSTEPLGAWISQKCITHDSVSGAFYLNVSVHNRQIPIKQLTHIQKRLPAVNSILYVLHMLTESTNSPLCVPVKSLKRDDNGWFVWRARNRKRYSPESGFPRQFTVEKAYVTPGKSQREFIIAKYQALDNPGSLRLHDVVVTDCPPGLQDGGEAYLVQKRWLFQPGDRVKVDIPVLSHAGAIAVSTDAVHTNSAGNPFIYAVKSSQAVIFPVQVVASYGEKTLIGAKGLNEQARIIISSDEEPADGMQVNIVTELLPAYQ